MMHSRLTLHALTGWLLKIKSCGDSLLLLILLSVYPPVFLYGHNIGRFPFTVTVAPAITIALLIIILWAALSSASRRPGKIAFILSINLLLFFSYGAFAAIFSTLHFHIGGICVIGYNKLYAAICMIINLCFILITAKQPEIESTGRKILLVTVTTALILALIPVFTARKTLAVGNKPQPDEQVHELVEKIKNSKKSFPYPDIYHIILDAYPRSDMLKKYFNHDNSKFMHFLAQQGFIIPATSWSNYTCTDLCLPSLLNFRYVHEDRGISPDGGPQKINYIRQLKANSLVMQFLKQLGYATFVTENGFEGAGQEYADHFIGPHADFMDIVMYEFLHGMVRMTPARLLMRFSVAKKVSYFEQHRKRILSALAFLEHAPQIKGPKYVFAHIIAPHIPIVFGPHGEEIRQGPEYLNNPQADPVAFLQASRGEIMFLDSAVARTLSRMISVDSTCVIILQSDHGEYAIWPQEKGQDSVLIPQRHGILNALRIPGLEMCLPDTMTAINTYPILFNALFGTGIPLRKNRVYFSFMGSPFRLREVSDLLGLVN